MLDLTTVSVSVIKEHHTNVGLKANKAFTVNIPSVDMAREVDFCGTASGKTLDKSLHIKHSFGKLGAPLAMDCPLSMECRTLYEMELPKYNIYIGQIVQTHCKESFATGGKIDLEKLQPIMFSMYDLGYWNLVKRFTNALFPFKRRPTKGEALKLWLKKLQPQGVHHDCY